MKTIKVYIPSDQGRTEPAYLLPGSAIVAYDDQPPSQALDAYYEGNAYQCSNLQSFEEKAVVAAGRLHSRYPTIARSLIPRDLLLEVGELQMLSDPEPPNFRMLPPHLRKQFKPRERLRFVATHHAQQRKEWAGN